MPDDITPEPSAASPEPTSIAVSSPQTIAAAQPQSAPDPQKPTTPPSMDFNAVVPIEFQNKPYMKEVDSFDKLFKDFDNAQHLIGQKSFEVPKADAPEEEITAYLDKVRPESADVYELPETEYTKKFGRDEEFGTQMKGLFQKAGLLPHQAKILTEGYDAALFGKANEMAAGAEGQAADFEKMADGHFGGDKDAKLKIANEILKENTPDAFKEYLGNLPNESLMVLSAVLNNVADKYMGEDKLNIGGKPAGADPAAIQEEARQLMASPEYKDFRHPKHDATVARVNELYGQVGSIKK